MLFIPCEICKKPVNEMEAEQSLNFTEKTLDIPTVLCKTCRYDSYVLASIVNNNILKE